MAGKIFTSIYVIVLPHYNSLHGYVLGYFTMWEYQRKIGTILELNIWPFWPTIFPNVL